MSKLFKVFSSLLLLFGCGSNKVTFVNSATTLEDVQIQPAKALEIAEARLGEHGTVVWKDEANLETVIVKKGSSYYIKRSDFPAKTANWYLFEAIRVSAKDGTVTFTQSSP